MLVKPNSTKSFAKNQAGGKGYNLYHLSKNGISVPEWVVVCKKEFEDFCTRQDLNSKISEITDKFLADSISADEAEVGIKSLFMNAKEDAILREIVNHAFSLISTEGGISVRSSAADEDGSSHSFAGQLSSFLYVTSAEDAYRYTLQCWASGFTERGLIYRREKKISLQSIKVSVVFQKMIDPDASGVMFTCDIINQSLDKFLVSSVYGVGEGLVSGILDADNFWLNSEDGVVIESEIAEKSTKLSKKDSGECVETPVSDHEAKSPSLSSAALKLLFDAGRKIHDLYGTPQDIEWAIKDGKLFILQTRPVTTLKSQLTGYPNLWDNSNIVESYGGLTSPLSFSFALRNYRNVYIQFCEVLHVPRQVVKDMESYLGFMLGNINGRVFYNLYNWYKLVGVLPGFKQNRQFMETMMGVGESLTEEIANRIKPHASWDTFVGKLRKTITGFSFLYYHLFIQKIVDRYLSDFKSKYDYYRKLDYDQMSPDQVYQTYLEMEGVMLGHWKAPIINDFLCMVHFGLLKKLTNSWLSKLDANIQNDLLAGDGNYESAEPTRKLIELAGQISSNKQLEEWFVQQPSAYLYEILKHSEHQSLYQEIRDYLDRFGFRCMNEMKLEETDLSNDPSFLFDCIKNYIRSGTTDLATYEEREKKLRRDSENAVRKALSGFKRYIYVWVLHHARKAVRNRENTRFCRTRAYGVGRIMFHSMGEKLAGMGIIENSLDIFYLTIEEIEGVFQGTLSTYNLKDFINLRKAEYERYEDLEPKIRFQTRGPVYWQNDFIDVPETPEVEEGADYDLKGIACCPGIIERKVKIVHSPKDDLSLDGEILVCKRTDPGWVPLFPSASALLVERGSLLSHSAIVAREMGIPAIVGIKGLLNTLETGMIVRMDGSKGTIKIISKRD